MNSKIIVEVAKNSGFCFGVEKAVDTALTLSNTKPILTFGKLIHNNIVVKMLEDKGIKSVDTILEFISKCKTDKVNYSLLIRSHGVGKDIINELDTKKIQSIDCTCPFVKNIHNIVEKYYLDGYQIVIIGDSEHVEVKGINGWCDNTAIIINREDFGDIIFNKSICIVVQTTYNEIKFEKIAENIEKLAKNEGKIVVKNNTICYTTKERQKECIELAKKCDTMLVVGEKFSSNTLKLYELASKYCDNSFLISKINDIESIKFNNTCFLGITAGASTPKELIEEVKQKAETQLNKEIKEDKMAELLASHENQDGVANLKEGKTYPCTVINASEDGINVNFGGKRDGFIDRNNVELDGVEYDATNYKPGDVIKAVLIPKTKKEQEYASFSKKLYDTRAKENEENEKVLNGKEFKVVVDSASDKGLVAKYNGYHVFIPASQIRSGYVSDLASYIGKPMRLRRIPEKKSEDGEPQELNPKIKGKRIVASQKVILEEEKAKKIAEQKSKEEALFKELISVIREGDIVQGKVKRFSSFGAFVSVNGYDCLAHNSDLSYSQIKDPSEVLEINKTYDFVVRKIEDERGKVSLGYKQLQKKPYEIALEKYPIGTVITGKVRSVQPYGAFILIEKNIDGLLPVSEIAYTYTKDPKEVYKEGDEVTAKIIKFEDNKITLSVKALSPAPSSSRNLDIETTEEDLQEAMEKRNSKTAKKFEKLPANTSGAKKGRSRRNDESQEEVSWTSENSGATMADLFKGLKLDLTDDEEIK